MAIAVGSTSNTPTYGNRVNSTITAPTGITNGDLLVACLHVGDAALSPVTVTPPAGWIEASWSPVSRSQPDPYTITDHIFYKVASGESGNYTFAHTSADTEGFMYRLTGVDTSTPVDVTGVTASGDSQTTTIGSVTTVTNGAFVIVLDSAWDAPGAGNWSGTTPTLTTRRTGTISKITDGTQATAGATGARTRTNGNAAAYPYTAILIAIRPATGGTSVNLTGASAAALAGTAVPSIGDSVSITGAACSAVAGGVSVTDSASPVGASAAAFAGSVAPSAAVDAPGAAASALAGSVAASGETTAVISGASVAAVAGAVGIMEDVSMPGASVQALAGGVSTSTGSGSTVNIAGAAVAGVAGPVTPSESVPVVGAAATAIAGGIATVARVAMTGAAAAALAGLIAAGVLSYPTGASVAALAGGVGIASSSSIGISGAEALAIAGNVSTRIVVTQLNPNYIASGAPRRMVATGFPRGRIARGAPRNRIVARTGNAMSQTNNLTPPIDASVEEETVTFDYGLILKPGVTLTGTPTITCEVYNGNDSDPGARIIGQWMMGVSPNTGAPDAAIYQVFGQMVAGTTYRLQCVCSTSDEQILSLWTHLGCEQPD